MSHYQLPIAICFLGVVLLMIPAQVRQNGAGLFQSRYA
jgi:hypothetical protein